MGQPTELLSKQHVCTCKGCRASVWSNSYQSKREFYLPAPLPITLLAFLTGSVTERSREELEKTPDGFYLEDKSAKTKKKIPFICTESCNFGLYFGKRWLTSLSLSCTTLAIAYFDLTTLFTCYCVWHPGIKPFDLCMALESYWLCYSTTNKNVEHLQVPHILTVRCFCFIQSMV